MLKRWFDRNKFHQGNSIKLIESGDEFFNELETIILQAKKFIHIQIYIFEDDKTGNHFITLLTEAIQRGVKVFVVADSYGSNKLHKSAILHMQEAGIRFKLFSVFHISFGLRIGRRLHHKIILADGEVGLVGGINISQKYHGDSLHRAWLDFAALVRGPICNDIQRVCEDIWKKKMKIYFKKEFRDHRPLISNKGDIKVRLLQNDFVRRNIEISRFYRQHIKRSKDSLLIVASYFLPGNRMRVLLKRASQRGVKIKVLVGKKSDVGLMKHATNFLYPFLLRNQIEIYEWKHSVMHGKMMIVDDRYTTIGSYNMNTLSDYGSLELNVLADNPQFALDSTEKINRLMEEGCVKILEHEYKLHHYWWNQATNWMSYQLMRNSLRLYFFLMRH